MALFSQYAHLYLLFCGFFTLGSFLRWPGSERKMFAALLLGLAAAATTHALLLQLS